MSILHSPLNRFDEKIIGNMNSTDSLSQRIITHRNSDSVLPVSLQEASNFSCTFKALDRKAESEISRLSMKQ